MTMISTLGQSLVERIMGETGLSDHQAIAWLDWFDGVVATMREDDYAGYTPRDSTSSKYDVFAALVPLHTQVSADGSVHQLLEQMFLFEEAKEYGITHVVRDSLPYIEIRHG